MAFQPLGRILVVVESQIEQQAPLNLLKRLQECWPEIVGAKASVQSRPISIDRNIVWVAVSSAAWAQNLTLGRRRILKQLNGLLPAPAEDIRFSTANWQERQPTAEAIASELPQHPSSIGSAPAASLPSPRPQTPQAAWQNWARSQQLRSACLPLCPQCQCPTPPGELQRWSVCAICAARQRSTGSGEREK